MKLENPVFKTIEEETAILEKKKQKEEACRKEKEFQHQQIYIRSEYKRYEKRYQLGLFQRYLKGKGIAELESYLPFQVGVVEKFIANTIEILKKEEIQSGKKIEYSQKRKVYYNAAIEIVIKEIEDSFVTFEKEMFEKIILTIEPTLTCSAEKIAASYIMQQKSRLICSVIRDLYDLSIQKIENTFIRNHDNGFEGKWLVRLTDNTTKEYTTHTIIAGGNIQRLHYRYITRLI